MTNLFSSDFDIDLFLVHHISYNPADHHKGNRKQMRAQSTGKHGLEEHLIDPCIEAESGANPYRLDTDDQQLRQQIDGE